jgi:penicillin-binding protein 2
MDSLSSANSQSWLPWFLRGLLILLFLILFAKLFETQIIKGDYYRQLSEQNRIRHVVLPAPRGKILASNGEEIATNVSVKKRIKLVDGGDFSVTDDLTNMTEEELVTDYIRVYPLGDELSHALGYLAKVGPNEIGKINPKCPQKGPRLSDQLIGKTGLEEEYECLLAGIPGEELIEVNTNGNQIRVLGKREPIAGKDIKISLDYGLQKEVAKEMTGKKGAAVVTDASGRILAFYSNPTFDPNLFIGKNHSQEISALLNNKDLPFFDRAISGTFHPGSVFKPITVLAALQEGAISKNFTYEDPGIITINNFSYANWYFTQYGRTEGLINLTRALARSTDTFFYTIGAMVGPDAIAKWANIFGLGSPTGIDIPGEVGGLIPTPDWKKEYKKEAWFLGNTYHMAIGQGDVAVTPIEINTYISAIANGGSLCRPHFFLGSGNPDCKELNLKQTNLDLIKEGMEAVCTTGGTGYTFFDFPDQHGGIKVACKTGTAEVGTVGASHAWFTMFAPVNDPQIVATVLIEGGGEGSSVAGPIARKIADYYFP